MKEKTIEQRQKEYEKKAKKVQGQIEILLKKNSMALVANYVKEKNMVSLELIPQELADARNKMIQQTKELIESEGDKIGNGEPNKENPNKGDTPQQTTV